MYTHLTIGSNDLEKSRQFYDAIFTAAGGKPGTAIPDMGRVVYAHNGNVLIVTTPINREPAYFGNGITIGIGIGSPA